MSVKEFISLISLILGLSALTQAGGTLAIIGLIGLGGLYIAILYWVASKI